MQSFLVIWYGPNIPLELIPAVIIEIEKLH